MSGVKTVHVQSCHHDQSPLLFAPVISESAEAHKEGGQGVRLCPPVDPKVVHNVEGLTMVVADLVRRKETQEGCPGQSDYRMTEGEVCEGVVLSKGNAIWPFVEELDRDVQSRQEMPRPDI